MLLEIANKFSLLSMLLGFAIIYLCLRKAQSGKVPNIRPLPAIDAIPEAIGRAVELGRPVFAGPGLGGIEDQWAAETMSALNILQHTAQHVAELGADMMCLVVSTTVQPLAEDAIKTGFTLANESDKYDPGIVRFVAGSMAYDVSIVGISEREKPAAAVYIGAYWHPGT
ncbi:unnamed protein product, partial [marine sediment metagenome]